MGMLSGSERMILSFDVVFSVFVVVPVLLFIFMEWLVLCSFLCLKFFDSVVYISACCACVQKTIEAKGLYCCIRTSSREANPLGRCDSLSLDPCPSSTPVQRCAHSPPVHRTSAGRVHLEMARDPTSSLPTSQTVPALAS